MLDLRILRHDTDRLKEGLAKRLESVDIDRLLSLDQEYRELLAESEALRAERNTRSKEIGALMQSGETGAAEDLKAEVRDIGARIQDLDDQAEAIKGSLDTIWIGLPNLPHETVPAGDITHNEIVRSWGEPRTPAFQAKPHWDVGEGLGVLDLKRAAKVAGSGFTGLIGQGAALSRALVTFMLDRHRVNGYIEIAPPLLVNADTATATGHLPKFGDQLYTVERDDLYLIPTAEVPIMGWHRDEILEVEQLPLRYCAYTPCFRREAGAHGSDTRGLIRVHQFDKVELVKITTPDTSYEELESLTEDAESILQALDLPYRVVLLAAGDTGNAATKTYDLEVWSPGVEKWLEVSSCSNCETYQARRGQIRFRGSDGVRYPHTLNGSGVALARTLIAILENYQTEDGDLNVPEVLRSYLGGVEILHPETNAR